tara:strand:- start:352 stop:528 length:177 start_codon:yes stop_codon:yes gene_type:complete
MEYIWTDGYVKDLALANRKVDSDTLYQVCMTEASDNKEEALNLYSLVKEAIKEKYRKN